MLSASSTNLALYDGTQELDYRSPSASADAGTLEQQGAGCTTDPVVCGGLTNIYYSTPPIEQTADGGAMPATGTGSLPPFADIYAATGVTVFNETATSAHSQRFSVEFVPATGVDGGAGYSGSFRIAFARDEAFSTRLTGSYGVDPVAHTITFDSTCPSAQAAAGPTAIAFDAASTCDLTLYVPASFLDLSGKDEAIVLRCD